MGEIGVAPSDDIAVAGWIAPRLRPFNEHVGGSVVPTGFEAYARIDHEREGVLPAHIADTIVSVLARHTTTPDACWMALWAGYGYVDIDSRGRSWQVMFASGTETDPPPPSVFPWPIPPQRSRTAPRVHLPQRDYVLYRGSLPQVTGWMDGPNLWWPEDRAWCVASEIDLRWTYIGGTNALVEDLTADRNLGCRLASTYESIAAEPPGSGS